MRDKESQPSRDPPQQSLHEIEAHSENLTNYTEFGMY